MIIEKASERIVNYLVTNKMIEDKVSIRNIANLSNKAQCCLSVCLCRRTNFLKYFPEMFGKFFLST